MPTLSPDDADVAFALEGMPWVQGVYVVDREGQKTYFVHLHPDGLGYAMAEVHYALMRSRGRMDSADVQVIQQLFPSPKLRKVDLDATAREGARTRARDEFLPEVLAERASARTPAHPPPHESAAVTFLRRFQVMVVDDDPATARAAREVFPHPHSIVAVPYVDTALALAWCWRYDRVVVGDAFAWGDAGFLPRFATIDGFEDTPVAITVAPGRLAKAVLETLPFDRPWQCLPTPLEPSTLARRFGRRADVYARSRSRRTAATTEGIGSVMLAPTGAGPVHSVTKPVTVAAPLPKVLLVDATLDALDVKRAAASRLHVTIAITAEEAEGHLAREFFALVLCDATLRTSEGFVYRRLWESFPGTRAKTILVTSQEREAALPPSDDPSRPRRLLARPLAVDAIERAVRTFGRPKGL